MKNLALLTDFYQFTMMNGLFEAGITKKRAVFDLFFRQNGQINYAIAAGLHAVCDYIEHLRFSEHEIDYLRGLNRFSEGFLQYLKGFRFSGDIYSVREGTPVFPNEPILIVHAPLVEAMLVETAVLNLINHQTLIATKATKIVDAAKDASVVEFGTRRAYGPDAAVYGARAAIIGGFMGTSNVLSAMSFDMEVLGTQAHSWVMSFDSELEAFREFARVYPDGCMLLADTYDTLKSGVPNAIKVFEELKSAGHKPLGIRIDSGDLAYLSKKAREMLDAAGFEDAKIMASNDVDENLITSLILQGARIDLYGVGTKLITSSGMGSLGGVYKMAALQEGDEFLPKMKISNSIEKATNPGFKELYRLYDNKSGMAIADLICLKGEQLSQPLILRHPVERWKSMVLEDYRAEKLLVQVFKDGKKVYKNPKVKDIAKYCRQQKSLFWDEYKRLVKPHLYKVDLSDELYRLKEGILTQH